MGQKKIERDLRDVGLRKKRARTLAKAADRSRAGDRAARKLVDQQAAALSDSVSAVVRNAKPPATKSARKTSAKKRPAKKRPARKRSSKNASTKRAASSRSESKATGQKTPTAKVAAA
jgi:hypothetical protein